MTPLRYVVLGVAVVMLDVPVHGFDLVADPVGWALVLVGLAPLAARYPQFEIPRNTAVVGLVTSLPLAVVHLRPLPGLVVDEALELAIVFTLCAALADVVEDPAAARLFGTARWWDATLTAALVLSVVAGLTGPAVLLLVADLVLLAWVASRAWLVSDARELLPR